jgi:hypothetical protein
MARLNVALRASFETTAGNKQTCLLCALASLLFLRSACTVVSCKHADAEILRNEPVRGKHD